MWSPWTWVISTSSMLSSDSASTGGLGGVAQDGAVGVGAVDGDGVAVAEEEEGGGVVALGEGVTDAEDEDLKHGEPPPVAPRAGTSARRRAATR